jgi:hypothetical protein
MVRLGTRRVMRVTGAMGPRQVPKPMTDTQENEDGSTILGNVMKMESEPLLKSP